MCHNLWMTGRPAEARGFGQSALVLAESLEDVPLQVTGNLYLGAACCTAPDFVDTELMVTAAARMPTGDAEIATLIAIVDPEVMVWLDVLPRSPRRAHAAFRRRDCARTAAGVWCPCRSQSHPRLELSQIMFYPPIG